MRPAAVYGAESLTRALTVVPIFPRSNRAKYSTVPPLGEQRLHAKRKLDRAKVKFLVKRSESARVASVYRKIKCLYRLVSIIYPYLRKTVSQEKFANQFQP